MSWNPTNILFIDGIPVAHGKPLSNDEFAEVVEDEAAVPLNMRYAAPYNCISEISPYELLEDICQNWHSGVAMPSDAIYDSNGEEMEFLLLEDPQYWEDAKNQLISDGFDENELEARFQAYVVEFSIKEVS